VPADDYKSWHGDWWSPKTRMVYSLSDLGGALALSMAMNAQGAPLAPRDGGRLVLPAGGIGEIEVAPGPDDAVTIRFGSEDERYERLTATAADAAAFAASAAGTYFSADADATAVISAQGDALSIRISNGLGELTGPVIPLSAAVGYVKPASLLAPYRSTISLEPGPDGHASGFQLCTARTRNLEFERV
jgi:hypothetical protein